jgi:hypothetical protein
MKKPASPTLLFSTFAAIFLMAAVISTEARSGSPVVERAPPPPSDDPDAEPSAGPTGLPSELTDPNSPHVLAEKCRAAVNGWVSLKNEAQGELAACNLHRFNAACLRMAEERKKILAKDAPCMRIPDAREKISKLPEVNCNIVNVPGSCASK